MSAVRVEEIRIVHVCSRETIEWWHRYRWHGPESRFTALEVRMPGDLVEVACEDREHAEWLHGFLLEQGIPKSALKVIP